MLPMAADLTFFFQMEKFLPAEANDNVADEGSEVAPADNGAPVPQSEEEASMSEYYKNYYAQLYAQAAQDYQEQLVAYDEAMAAADQSKPKDGKPSAPDDGYVIPKPQFESYQVSGQFAKVQGRFMADGQGGAEYWEGQGRQHDRPGRQLDQYYDVEAHQKAMSEGRVVGNESDPSKKNNKRAKTNVPSFMADDPLEGAFQKPK